MFVCHFHLDYVVLAVQSVCVCARVVSVCAETIVGLFFPDNKQCNEVNGGGQKQSFNVYGIRSSSIFSGYFRLPDISNI